MKYLSPLISDARNKLGGTVFARNRSGPYSRAKVAPLQPRTTSQVANRANFATLSASWKTLTQPQILGWNNAADQQTLTDSLGQSYMPTGLQLFMSCNRNLSSLGVANITDAPPQKPSFPSTAGSVIAMAVGMGIVENVYIQVPDPLIHLNAQIITRWTASLSPGISFVAPHLFRNIGVPAWGGDNYWIVTTEYVKVYPLPTVGSTIAASYTIIDPATGYASTPCKMQTIVGS
jgi:hypothetical protein